MLPIKLYSAPNGTVSSSTPADSTIDGQRVRTLGKLLSFSPSLTFHTSSTGNDMEPSSRNPTSPSIPTERYYGSFGGIAPVVDVNQVPSIEDPNTGVTVWESGACVLYLIETYDKYHELSYEDSKLKHLLNSWVNVYPRTGHGG